MSMLLYNTTLLYASNIYTSMSILPYSTTLLFASNTYWYIYKYVNTAV